MPDRNEIYAKASGAIAIYEDAIVSYRRNNSTMTYLRARNNLLKCITELDKLVLEDAAYLPRVPFNPEIKETDDGSFNPEIKETDDD